MNVHKLVAALFEHLRANSGRDLAAGITEISPETFFPEAPPEEDQGGLEKAACAIGESLAGGSGPIGLIELADAVDAFGQQSGTGWCPPLAAVLRDAADRV
jgi:hypothetical protein